VRSDVIAHQLEFEDVNVRIYGDVAVITGRNKWRPGTRFVTLPLRFTEVLTRKNGYWQRSAIQVGFEGLPRYILLTNVTAAAITLLIAWVFPSTTTGIRSLEKSPSRLDARHRRPRRGRLVLIVRRPPVHGRFVWKEMSGT
jgi:Domain of unknown function (DUF4440)